MKIGFATIGEAPREDLVPFLREQLPAELEVAEAGVLNGLSHDEIMSLNAHDDTLHLVTRTRSGASYRLNYQRTLPLMQRVVDDLVGQGVDLVVILCGADWSPVRADVPVVNPGRLFPNLIQALGGGLKLGVIKPDAGQVAHTEAQYRGIGLDPYVTAASPYQDNRITLAREAALFLKERNVDLVWMTCVGMDEAMRAAVNDVLPRPTILARSILAKVISEMLPATRPFTTGVPI